uniref:Acyl carrier protein n=1 Tax=Meloidogyne floridensis TaxID=298350 RepID=A0A915PA36_9BILA
MISFSYAIISRNFINKLKYPKIHLIRTFSLSNLRNKIADEFDNSAFENTFGFNFKKEKPKTSKEVEERLIAILYKFDKRKDFLFNLEIKQKVLEIIKRQPSINEELIKEKGLFARFGSLGINNSKRELFNEICNEFDIQLPLGEYDNIQNGLDICDIVCDLINAEK